MMIRVLQTNLGRSRAAHDLTDATAARKNIELLVVAEPNKNIVRKQNNNWLSHRNSDVAIKIRNRRMGIKDHTKGNKGWIRIEMTGYDIYCYYISPNIERNEFKAITDEIMTEVKTRAREAIIMGDINAKSYQCGLATADVRGEYWTMWMAEINSIVINEGTTATFIRGESKPYIDVTCATIKITKDIVTTEVF